RPRAANTAPLARPRSRNVACWLISPPGARRVTRVHGGGARRRAIRTSGHLDTDRGPWPGAASPSRSGEEIRPRRSGGECGADLGGEPGAEPVEQDVEPALEVLLR